MKRSEMGSKLSLKLQKSENLFKGYSKGSIDLKCLCDNLQERILNFLESEGMLPPFNQHDFHMDGDNADRKSITYRTWENENE